MTQDANNKPGEQSIPGAAIAAAIMRRLPPDQRARVMKEMSQQAPTVVAKVEEFLYRFDITRLTPQGLQTVLQVADARDIALSTQKAPPKVREQILKNLSERKLQSVKQELTSPTTPEPQSIEDAQRRLMKLIDEMEAQGKISSAAKPGRYA